MLKRVVRQILKILNLKKAKQVSKKGRAISTLFFHAIFGSVVSKGLKKVVEEEFMHAYHRSWPYSEISREQQVPSFCQ